MKQTDNYVLAAYHNAENEIMLNFVGNVATERARIFV